MKKTYCFLMFLIIITGINCQKERILPENPTPISIISFKIVDNNYNDLIIEKNGISDTIEIFYKDNSGEHQLEYLIFNYENGGFIVTVYKLPELSSAGIKNYYLRFNSYPIDSLYLDIRQKKELNPSSFSSDCFNYIELKCNGIEMEYNERYTFYYIKKSV